MESTTERTKPLRDRGLMRYDEETIQRIVDEALVCHAGYQVGARRGLDRDLHALPQT